MCEKSFSEDRLIKSHIKTNHPGKVMHFGEEINFIVLMFTLKHSIMYQLHKMGIKGDERMSEFEGHDYIYLMLGS